MDDELPQCPNCDATLKPERLSAERFLCPCCGRVFKGIPPKR